MWVLAIVFCGSAGAEHGSETALADRVAGEGQEILIEDFEDEALALARWSYGAGCEWTEGRSGRGVQVTQTGDGETFLVTQVPAEGLDRCLLMLTANIRGAGISEPAVSWLGVKVMLRLEMADGRVGYPQVQGCAGDFDWINRGVLAYVSGQAERITLFVGLQGVTGSLWVDDISLSVARGPAFPVPEGPACPVMRPPGVERLRGAMVSPEIDEASLRVLGQEWQANVIRWQLGSWDFHHGLATPDFEAALEDQLQLLDAALPICREIGLNVIVDMHSLAGGLFDSVAAQDRLVQAWRTIASRYVGESIIWAYDLVNEPDALHGAFGDGVQLWEPLAERLIDEIRTIDTGKVFIVESPHGAPWTFEGMRPLRRWHTPIVYSAHVYDPHEFTHQTLYGLVTPYVYPGVIAGEFWDKARLMEALAPVRTFQDKYHVPVIIGEFSAIRWAPQGSALPYLRDALEIFESYGWDWCYHAFREWHGWSVEHSEDPADLEPTLVPNDRQRLLRTYLERNQTGTPSSTGGQD